MAGSMPVMDATVSKQVTIVSGFLQSSCYCFSVYVYNIVLPISDWIDFSL